MKYSEVNDRNDVNYQYEWNKNFEDSLKTLMLYSWWILWWILTIFIANYEKFQLIKINKYILLLVLICFLLAFIFSLLWKFFLTFLAYSIHDSWKIKDKFSSVEKCLKSIEKVEKVKNNLDIIKEDILYIKNFFKNFENILKEIESNRFWVSLCFSISLMSFFIWICFLSYLFFEIVW